MSCLTNAETTRAADLPAELSALVEGLLQAVGPDTDPAAAQRRLLEEALVLAAEARLQVTQHRARIAQLEALSSTDELTGLLNRRGFRDELSRVLARAARYHEPSVLLVIDIDQFKHINDRFGHLAGDHLLRFLAELLRRGVRQSDSVARLGGDEFAVIMTNTIMHQGHRRAEVLDLHINQAKVPWQDIEIPLRASVGITVLGPGDDGDALLHRADLAMYERKTGQTRRVDPYAAAAAA